MKEKIKPFLKQNWFIVSFILFLLIEVILITLGYFFPDNDFYISTALILVGIVIFTIFIWGFGLIIHLIIEQRKKIFGAMGIILQTFLKFIGILILIALLVYMVPKIIDFLKPDTWTLFVCKTKLNEAECYENSYEIPGFKSKKECLLEGASRFPKEGFECGSNCKSDYGLNICKEVCNSFGCH